MYAIVSLLDPFSEQEIRALWSRFELKCGLTRIKNLPIPHFTWMAADALQLSAVDAELEDLSSKLSPVVVHSAGAGIFTGSLPVVYINLVKNETLLNYHRRLWEKIRPFMIVPNPFYHPDNWVPHITLAYKEGNPDQLSCAILDIAYMPLDFSVMVDNVAIISNNDDQNGLQKQFALRNKIS